MNSIYLLCIWYEISQSPSLLVVMSISSSQSCSVMRDRPETSSYKMHPQAQISPRSSVMVMCRISGLMYSSVPTKELALLLREYIFMVDVSSMSSFANPSSLERPSISLKQMASSKSIILRSPLLLKEMFEGFRSRCATATDLRYSRPSANWYIIYLIKEISFIRNTLSLISSRLPFLQASNMRNISSSSSFIAQYKNLMMCLCSRACRILEDLISPFYFPFLRM